MNFLTVTTILFFKWFCFCLLSWVHEKFVQQDFVHGYADPNQRCVRLAVGLKIYPQTWWVCRKAIHFFPGICFIRAEVWKLWVWLLTLLLVQLCDISKFLILSESHLRWKQTNSMTMQGFWCCKYYRWLFLISHCLPTMFLLMEFIDDEEGVKLFFWAKQEEEAAHGLRDVQGRFKGCFQCDVWCSSLQHLKYYLLCSGDYGRLDLLYQDKGRVESFFKKGLGWAWKPGNDAGPWGLGTPGNWGSTMFMELCSIKDCGCCR